jgi:hypothetical protein
MLFFIVSANGAVAVWLFLGWRLCVGFKTAWQSTACYHLPPFDPLSIYSFFK